MNHFKIATAAAAILAATSFAAFGAEATGAIQSIDPAARTITLLRDDPRRPGCRCRRPRLRTRSQSASRSG